MRIILSIPGVEGPDERIVTVAVPPRAGERVFFAGAWYHVEGVDHHFEGSDLHPPGAQTVRVNLRPG